MRAAAVALTLLFLLAGRPALAETPEARMHRLINTERVERGLNRLRVTSFLRYYAERRSRVLGKTGSIFPHDPCAGCAEVTAAAPLACYARCVLTAWIRSDVHRNILFHHYANRLGCGHVRAAGLRWWTCELRFRYPSAPTSPPTLFVR